MTAPADRDWALLGMSEFEGRLYRMALQHPDHDPRGWAESLQADVETVRQGVTRLIDLGLLSVELNSSSAGAVRAVDPHLALRSVLRAKDEALLRVAAMAEKLADEYDQGRLRSLPDRLVEVIVGERAHSERLQQLYAGAEREIVMIDTPPYVVSFENNQDAQSDALARGIRFRTIYAVAALDDPDRLQQARNMVARGERAKVVARVPLKLVMIDGRTAMTPLTNRESGADFHAVLIHQSTLTLALQTLFESFWEIGTALGGYSGSPNGRGSVNKTDQLLLELLSLGLKDEAIARQLGVSVRTLRRRIGDLQDRLGAAGRFQAGVQAAKRGWI